MPDNRAKATARKAREKKALREKFTELYFFDGISQSTIYKWLEEEATWQESPQA